MESLYDLRKMEKEEVVKQVCEFFGEDDYAWVREMYDKYGVDGLVDLMFDYQLSERKQKLQRMCDEFNDMDAELCKTLQAYEQHIGIDEWDNLFDSLEAIFYKLDEIKERIIAHLESVNEKRKEEKEQVE